MMAGIRIHRASGHLRKLSDRGDVSLATRPTGRHDCNRDAIAGLDAAHWAKAEAKLKQKKIKRLQQNAAALGFKLLTAS